MNEYIYAVFLRLYDKFSEGTLRTRILQCLGKHFYLVHYAVTQPLPGFLFRAQPALLTADTSSRIMDDIFSSSDEDARGRLLKIMQDFLVSEADKHAVLQKEKGWLLDDYPGTHTHFALTVSKSKSAKEKVDMEELVGNTDGFAESG